MKLHKDNRIRHTETGRTGRFLRYEKYPGSPATWATVKWDDSLSARRIEPAKLERIVVE